MKLFWILDFRFSIVGLALCALVFALSAPAFAQRDTLKMGESLGATVVKKAELKKLPDSFKEIKEKITIEPMRAIKEPGGKTK